MLYIYLKKFSLKQRYLSKLLKSFSKYKLKYVPVYDNLNIDIKREAINYSINDKQKWQIIYSIPIYIFLILKILIFKHFSISWFKYIKLILK